MKVTMDIAGQCSRIVITGFMASGKTEVAKALANLLNCPATDLDEIITAREGRTPQEIIDEDGEERFRALESKALSAALAGPVGVIALGGGAWMIPQNRILIENSQGITIWLDTPFELCWQRIVDSGASRPLARQRDKAEELYYKRRPVYRLAQLQFEAGENLSAAEVALAIARALETFR